MIFELLIIQLEPQPSSRCNYGDLGIKRKDHIHLRFDLNGLAV